MGIETVKNQNEVVIQEEVSQDDIERIEQDLRNHQSIVKGIIGGIVAGVIGAILWALITVMTEYQIGWMAIGVGFLVGQGVRIMGKGIDKSFSMIGAVLSLFGCVFGNLLTICVIIAQQESLSIFHILSLLNLNIISELLTETFQPMDILFYSLAIAEGYKLSTIKQKQENANINHEIINEEEKKKYIL